MTAQKKKRIGMVVHAYYLRDARVIRYAEALANAGHEPHVVCLKDPDEPKEEVVNGVHIYRVSFERRRGGKIWYMLEYLWAFILFTIRLTRLEFRHHFDIVHVHNMPDFLIFAGFISRVRGAKLILDLHDPMPELFMSKFGLKDNWVMTLLRFQERISLAYSKKLITVDDSFKDMFVERGTRADKINIVRNMPDQRFMKAYRYNDDGENIVPRESSDFTLIYAGTIAERYQLDNIIRSVHMASKEIPNLRFKIVGKLDKEGTYTQILLDLVGELELQNVVEFCPPVPLDDIPGMLQQADLGLEPSRRDPYTDYVLPLKLLECVAVGVPCLVSRRPTISNYFEDNEVIYFEPDNMEGLSRSIIELANQPDELKQIALRAHNIFDRYNWETEKATYFEVCEIEDLSVYKS